MTVLNRKPRKSPILGRLKPKWPLSRAFHPLPSSLIMKGSVPEFGLPSCLHRSIVPVIDLLQATLQPLQFRRPVALHPANGLRHSGFASHDFFALRRRRSRALQIETQLGVLGPGRFDAARITLGAGEGDFGQPKLTGFGHRRKAPRLPGCSCSERRCDRERPAAQVWLAVPTLRHAGPSRLRVSRNPPPGVAQ